MSQERRPAALYLLVRRRAMLPLRRIVMGILIGAICELLTGHQFGDWVRVNGVYSVGEWQQPRFERARCRWCRQEFVRPMKFTS